MFFICYTLIGKEKSNTISSVISSYAYKLENDYSAQLLEEFIESFKSRIPNKNWFKKAFSTIGYSHTFKFYMDEKEKQKAGLVLEIYEKYLSKKTAPEKYTVEHILPDSSSEQNSNIGNLLPLEKDLNEKCKDLTLDEKIELYKKSNFKSVQKFVQTYENKIDEFEVEKRMDYLAEDFYKMITDIK